jgi:hypothetical protein
MKKIQYLLLSLILVHQISVKSQNVGEEQVKSVMLAATRYMVDSVSYNGGYLWYYLPDFSRQWGEMEAYKTMVWLQHPGTISMGNIFLDAYNVTGDEYYYLAAERVAGALIWGQSPKGGWNYMIDFAGDKSLKKWYHTIGKNGWRLEEFQHYYGNSTFDDDVTVDAARFLLRIYLEKLDPKFKLYLDKAIDFILEAQYPLGGWPQRYPLKYDFSNHGHPDYSSYYTFNDDVIWENIHFLIQCYLTLGEQRFLDPIMRGMNFYIISQDGSGGWGQQLDMFCQMAGARSYELEALLPGTTIQNTVILMKFYEYTGDRKFLARIPDAIEWLEKSRLPKKKSEGGRYTHPTFVDPKTQEPVYVHRKGSNVQFGYYYHDNKDSNLLAHYRGKCWLPVEELKKEFKRVSDISGAEIKDHSPFYPSEFNHDETTPQKYYDLSRSRKVKMPDEKEVRDIIDNLDDKNRWLSKHAMVSNPYIGDGVKTEITDKYASTFVGDETDTSPFRDTSDQLYISTKTYIGNMLQLIEYLK